jgi:small subunit ribosomal protein S20
MLFKEVNHLPNIKSSERSVKTDAERRARNFAVRSTIKTVSRKVLESVTAGNSDEAKALLVKASRTIDKAAAKGVVHKNSAARKKSRLALKLNALAK